MRRVHPVFERGRPEGREGLENVLQALHLGCVTGWKREHAASPSTLSLPHTKRRHAPWMWRLEAFTSSSERTARGCGGGVAAKSEAGAKISEALAPPVPLGEAALAGAGEVEGARTLEDRVPTPRGEATGAGGGTKPPPPLKGDKIGPGEEKARRFLDEELPRPESVANARSLSLHYAQHCSEDSSSRR